MAVREKNEGTRRKTSWQAESAVDVLADLSFDRAGLKFIIINL